VTVKNTKTTNGKLMQFGTFVDREGGWIDTVHFPPVVSRMPFRGKGCYLIAGKVVEEFGYATIEVGSMQRLDYIDRV
jgi:DNA polymerase-3 subunit alpha